jgi:hypothetical protein
MRRFTTAAARASMLAMVAALTGACGDPDRDIAPDDTTHVAPATPAPTAVLDSAITVAMEPLDGSGYTGTVHVEADGERTLLTVVLRGAADGIHPGHLRVGRCAQPGDSMERMQPVVTDDTGVGEALTVVDRPAATLLDGNHIVTFRAADGSAAVACGELPTL